MYISSTLHRGLIIAGIAVLAVVGLLGWTRATHPVPSSQPLAANSFANNPEPVAAPADAVNDANSASRFADDSAYANAAPRSNPPNQVVYGSSPFAPNDYGM